MKKGIGFSLIGIILFLLLFAGTKPELFKEARFYEVLLNNYVKCNLCPNYCVLKENQLGICRSRQNIKGKLYSLVYGKPVAIHIDPIEKKPLNHFLPGARVFSLATAGCNLRCNFCQNWTISQTDPQDAQAYDLSPQEIISMAKGYGCKVIAFTYTEPTIFYEYMLDIAKLAKDNGMYTVWVTCGYINQEPLQELIPYLDAANIDLKGFSEDFYTQYTTGTLQPVLNTIKTCHELDLYFEITNLIIPQANDSEKIINEMCNWIKDNIGVDYPLHFSRFYPHYKLDNRPPTPLGILESAKKIAERTGIHYVYIGNVPGLGDDTFCPSCGRKIIERDGLQLINNFIEDEKCKFCGYKIPGIFE